MFEAGLQQMKMQSRSLMRISSGMNALGERVLDIEREMRMSSLGPLLSDSLMKQHQELVHLSKIMKTSAGVLEEAVRLYQKAEDRVADYPLPLQGGWTVRGIDLKVVREMAQGLGKIRL